MARMMTTKEIADYLKLHEITIGKYAKQGVIPALWIGHVWRFDRDTIDQWIAEGAISKPRTGKDAQSKVAKKPKKLAMKKKKKPTAIDKAIILLKDIRKNGTGRCLALSKKCGFHKATVSRILNILMKQGLLYKNADGSFSIADDWK